MAVIALLMATPMSALFGKMELTVGGVLSGAGVGVEVGVVVDVDAGVVTGVFDGVGAGAEQLQLDASIIVKVKITDKASLSILLFFI